MRATTYESTELIPPKAEMLLLDDSSQVLMIVPGM